MAKKKRQKFEPVPFSRIVRFYAWSLGYLGVCNGIFFGLKGVLS